MRNSYTGTVGLDASGFSEDQTRQYNFPAPQRGTVIDSNTVVLTPNILRGSAEIRDVVINEYAVGFTLWTQAAGGFLFGHHSGSILVDVSFQYFDSANPMSAEELQVQWEKAKAEMAAQYLGMPEAPSLDARSIK
jgi:hypothetical protein